MYVRGWPGGEGFEFREGISDTKAKLRIQEMEKRRAYLRKFYEAKSQRHTPFSIVYDCSAFSLAQIAQQMVYAMRLRKMI